MLPLLLALGIFCLADKLPQFLQMNMGEEKRSSVSQVGPRRFDAFVDVFDQFATDDRTLCSVDKQNLRSACLKAMDDLLAHLRLVASTPFVESADFSEAMLARWRVVLEYVYDVRSEMSPDYISRKQDFREKSVSEALLDIKKSLDLEIIPLPTTTERSSENKNLFHYAALSKYYFLGIIPVSIVERNDLELSRSYDHPLRPMLVDGIFQFAQHDIQHGNIIIGPQHQALQLKEKARCEALRKCIRSLEKSKGVTKRALYFILHEDREIESYLRRASRINGIHLLDFSLAHIFSKAKFDLYDVLGQSPFERGMACSSVLELELGEFHLSEMAFTDDLISEESIALLEKQTVFRRYAHIKKKMRNLLTRLKMRCQAEMQHEALPLVKDPEHTVLKAGLDRLIQNGFREALHADLTNLMNSFRTISETAEKGRCRVFTDMIDEERRRTQWISDMVGRIFQQD